MPTATGAHPLSQRRAPTVQRATRGRLWTVLSWLATSTGPGLRRASGIADDVWVGQMEGLVASSFNDPSAEFPVSSPRGRAGGTSCVRRSSSRSSSAAVPSSPTAARRESTITPAAPCPAPVISGCSRRRAGPSSPSAAVWWPERQPVVQRATTD